MTKKKNKRMARMYANFKFSQTAILHKYHIWFRYLSIVYDVVTDASAWPWKNGDWHLSM